MDTIMFKFTIRFCLAVALFTREVINTQ